MCVTPAPVSTTSATHSWSVASNRDSSLGVRTLAPLHALSGEPNTHASFFAANPSGFNWDFPNDESFVLLEDTSR